MITKRPLGKDQDRILQHLRKERYWSAGCGWLWGTRSRTMRLLDSLVERGLVTRTVEATGHTGVAASLYGRERIVYRATETPVSPTSN